MMSKFFFIQIENSPNKLKTLIDGLLDYSKSENRGGKIEVFSEIGKESKFIFNIKIKQI